MAESSRASEAYKYGEAFARRISCMTVAAGQMAMGDALAAAEAIRMAEHVKQVLAMDEEVVQGSFA
jgi:hypothetical protein